MENKVLVVEKYYEDRDGDLSGLFFVDEDGETLFLGNELDDSKVLFEAKSDYATVVHTEHRMSREDAEHLYAVRTTRIGDKYLADFPNRYHLELTFYGRSKEVMSAVVDEWEGRLGSCSVVVSFEKADRIIRKEPA
jgi:hypothetical protein